MLLIAVTAAAQARPDYSGAWVRSDTAAARPSVAATGDARFRTGDMGSGWGSPLTVTARPDSLIVEYELFSTYDLQPPVRMAFAMDGSPSRNTLNIGHAAYTQRGRLTWSGDTLVITTAHPLPPGVGARNGTMEVRQALSLEAPNVLVVTTSRSGAAGGTPSQTRTSYTKR